MQAAAAEVAGFPTPGAQVIPLLAAKTSLVQAVEAFIEHKVSRGRWTASTVDRSGSDVRGFARVDPSRNIGAVDVPLLVKYLGTVAKLALATQKSRYATVAEFLKWCERRGYLVKTPCAYIDPDDLPWLGKRARKLLGRGKTTLRNTDDCRAYLAACNRLRGPTERVAAALPLLTGLRSGELRHLRACDIDLDLSRIWVRPHDDDGDQAWNVKTAASKRALCLPAEVRADLVRLLAEHQGPALLFPRPRAPTEAKSGPGVARHANWLIKLVGRTCEKAKVRRVCPHGLRDTYATLVAEIGGGSAQDIGRLLGHADNGATARNHYIAAPEQVPALHLVPAPKPSAQLPLPLGTRPELRLVPGSAHEQPPAENGPRLQLVHGGRQ